MTDVTPNSVGLAWTVPEGQFDSFVIQYKDRDGQPQWSLWPQTSERPLSPG